MVVVPNSKNEVLCFTYRKHNPMKKGSLIRKVLFRHAASIYGTTDGWYIDRWFVDCFCQTKLREISQSLNCIFSESNYGPTTQSVVQYMVYRCSSLTPHIKSSNIRYSNPRSCKLRFASTVRRSIDRPSMLVMVPHLVRIP